jgi:hypothetical protein
VKFQLLSFLPKVSLRQFPSSLVLALVLLLCSEFRHRALPSTELKSLSAEPSFTEPELSTPSAPQLPAEFHRGVASSAAPPVLPLFLSQRCLSSTLSAPALNRVSPSAEPSSHRARTECRLA